MANKVLAANRAAISMGIVLAATGCGSHGPSAHSPATLQGYADIDALVRLHPGWPGVAQYDLALARMHTATVRINIPTEDERLAQLPLEDAQTPASPQSVLRGEKQQLESIREAQVGRVRNRRTLTRQRQIATLQQGWQREADADYVQRARQAQGLYLRHLRSTMETGDVQRLNLVLQIKALQEIVNSWKAATPPTPRLMQAREDLAQKQALLANLDAGRSRTLQADWEARHKTIAEAVALRDVYVQQLTQQTEAALLKQDTQQTRAFAQSLVEQEQALLKSQQVHAASSVAPLGSLAPETLPTALPAPLLSTGSTAKSQRQMQLAQTRLEAQRARWIAFIYDDTRAAVLDAAQKRHWVVTFAKTGPGTALTAPLEQILSRQGWKT